MESSKRPQHRSGRRSSSIRRSRQPTSAPVWRWQTCSSSNRRFQYFKRAIELRPEFATAYLNLGLAQVRLGEDAAAMASLQRPSGWRRSSWMHIERWALFSKLGRWSEAAASYRAVIRIQPDDVPGLLGLGVATGTLGDIDVAISTLTRLLSVRPDSVDGHLALGQTYANLERWLDALPHLSRAVELAPNNHNAQLSLGKALAKNGRPDQALRHTVRPPVSIRLTLRHSFASAWRSSISIVRQKLSRRSRKPFVCARAPRPPSSIWLSRITRWAGRMMPAISSASSPRSTRTWPASSTRYSRGKTGS